MWAENQIAQKKLCGRNLPIYHFLFNWYVLIYMSLSAFTNIYIFILHLLGTPEDTVC